ncbi:hypothetical protein VV11_023460 [Trichodesmium erythraeum 21-75]|nr:hypothetical protein [Trichodesmium erythraeum 21-75]
METTDWQTVIPAGMAITIFIGGMLMMFTNFWTDGVYKKTKKEKINSYFMKLNLIKLKSVISVKIKYRNTEIV